MSGERLKIVVTGGGTGGHLFPGLAIADALKERVPDADVLFVHTGKEFERTACGQAGYRNLGIPVEGFLGRGVKNQLAAGMKLLWAVLRAMALFLLNRPRLVIGVGGYASVPCVAAARLLFIPAALAEQNALPGRANRLMARMCGRVYATYEESLGYFPHGKAMVTGNPVRKALLDAARENPEISGAEARFHILVIGGSQGARGINQAICKALSRLPPEKFSVTHQSGASDFEDVSAVHAKWGGNGQVLPFFMDMDRRYKEADLVVCRAGATTLAELCALGKASILVPFPFAADNHQEKNARAMAREGAGEMILEKDLSGEVLAGRIKYFEGNPRALKDMRERARVLGRPDAARLIADNALAWVLRGEKTGGRS
jgi:UDP-N-acetylglucosamine--N-acetylmuramyl-(pentapeptide) pyrophosphoryl-undecaprenol N-acetylglucosamine transferase